MRRLDSCFLLALACGAPALAQDADVQKQLMQRQQQTDAFSLQLRQQQEVLRLAPGDLRGRQALEARQFSERQRLDNLSDQQLREVRPDGPLATPELRTYERFKADEERRPLVASPKEIAVPPVAPPPALIPGRRGIILEAPR